MKKAISVLAFLCIAFSAFAQVQLSQLFSDNMVLQRNSEAPIWGKAKAGATVSVTTSWDGKNYSAVAGPDGKWSVKVSVPDAGGPYSITFKQGRKSTVLKNVMSGDVWLCSGQSNMEMPVNGWGKVKNYEQEVEEASQYPGIRLLNLKMTYSDTPKDEFEVKGEYGWNVCDPASVANFSACAYFFGRELYKDQNIPIGLINSSYGGTCIESWISPDALATIASEKEFIQQGKSIVGTRQNVDSLRAIWCDQIDEKERGFSGKKAVWAETGFDDSSWKTIHVPGDIGLQGFADFDGSVWFRTTFDMPESFAGHEVVLKLGTVDDNDITYLNGRMIGETKGYPKEREYVIPARFVKAGKNQLTVRCVDTHGSCGIMGRSGKVEIACGSKSMDVSGDWKYCFGVTADEVIKIPEGSLRVDYPSNQFNSMINPLVPFSVKGALWYQGETNAGSAYQYRETLPLLIRNWRELWGNKMPFYIVQLANFRDVQTEPDEKDGWPELREAQSLAARTVEDAHMAVIIDLGDAKDIHPKNKQEVGRRLGLLARKYTYGENVAADSPMMESYAIEGSSVRIRFKNAKALKADGPVKGFVIAGGDHVFHFADARIDGCDVVVSCPEVKYPLAVRYAWASNPVCNLYNEAGLPASPFRTDDWPGVTIGRKHHN